MDLLNEFTVDVKSLKSLRVANNTHWIVHGYVDLFNGWKGVGNPLRTEQN